MKSIILRPTCIQTGENTGLVNSCSSKKRVEIYQSMDHEYKVGDYIQTGFSQTGFQNENMWVIVKSIDLKNNKICGELNNNPVYLTNVACGDKVFVDISAICNHTSSRTPKYSPFEDAQSEHESFA